jgi:hypothetical protein
VIGTRSWPRYYRCYQCAKQGFGRVGATIRLFVGTDVGAMMAGGYPACDIHARSEIEIALTTLLRNRDQTWKVTAYAIEPDEQGWPRLGRVIFTARPKPTALQGSIHAAAAPA